jgi:hypothetical protein
MRRSAIYILILGLLPLSATAQTTESLPPVPSPPTGPRASALPGQPIYGGQAFSATAQTTEPLLPVESAPSGPQAPALPGQPIYAGQTVTQRSRSDLDPIGVHVGDFFWFPRGEVDALYNGNIFATPSSTSDLITALQPGFDLLSSLPRNAINLRGGAALQDYAIHPSQNTATGFLSGDGHLDVDEASSFYGSAQAAHLYEPRTSPNSPGNAAEPVTYNNYSANIGYAQTGLRLGYEADLAVQSSQYNAVPAIGGGILPQSAQDVITSQAALRVSYELLPDYLGYIRTAGTLYDYQHTTPGGMRFNSTVYRVDLGLQVLPRHIIYGEAYLGYLTQIFAVSSLGSVSTPDAGGQVVWNVTGLTTLTFSGIRTFQTSNPAIVGTGVGYLSSVATVNIDHELWHNLLFNANVGYENDAYQGVSRTDNVFTGGIGVKYLLTRHLYFGLAYSYQQRASSGSTAGLPYSQSIVILRVSTQF